MGHIGPARAVNQAGVIQPGISIGVIDGENAHGIPGAFN